MYGVKELLENYTEKELADGCELALSEDISVTAARGVEGGERYLELSVIFPKEKGRRDNVISARVKLDEDNGEFVMAECNCLHFADDGYCCMHITALQTAWAMKNYGTQQLKDSPAGRLLAKNTGHEDPFVPGILRRTSGGLLELIKENQEESRKLPTHNRSDVQPGSLRLELYMAIPEKQLFEFKIGRDRTYVIKDLPMFVGAFDRHEQLDFGKSLSFTAYEEYFDDDARQLFSFLKEFYRLYKEGYGSYFARIGSSGARYACFNGRYYDALMEHMEGKIFYGADNGRLTFCGDEYRPEISVKKMEVGAVISHKPFVRLARTERWLYIREDGKIFRTPMGCSEKLFKFLGLFEQKKELFVSENDIPKLCRNVLADFADAASVSGEGLAIGRYLPEKPMVRLYLDNPQADMISCRPEAIYSLHAYPLGQKLGEEKSDGGGGRNSKAEMAALGQINPFFDSYDENGESYYLQGSEEKIYIFLTEVLPRLEKIGELYISDRLKKLKVRPASRINVGVSIDGGLLHLGMQSEEFDRDELMEILCAYDRRKKFYRLKNGSFLKMDEEQEKVFGALAECIRGVRKPSDGEWKIPLFRAMYLDEMLKDRDGVTVEKTREYRRLLENMRDAQDGVLAPPESLKDILREYQADGFRWIKMLKNNGFGGILADDMGLGKTLQVLAFLLSEKEAGKAGDDMRTLIITPASLVYNWKKEIERYTPSLNVAMITGNMNERKELIQNKAGGADVWITSYDLLKRDIGYYENITFANEILDEAQFVKNQTTNAAKSVRLVQSGFHMALTGTPIENRLSELWSIFDYLMPGFLYNYSRFREEIEIPIVGNQDDDVMARLHCLVHPFILRRLKQEVLKELPDKLEEEVSVSISGEQKRLYDAHVQRLKMFLAKQSKEEFSQGKLEILAELTKLRQLCCHPGMMLENYNGPNAKLDACMEILHQAIDGGHKVLLFSQFTTMLDAIGERLKADDIAFHRIDGSVNKEERMRLVDSFATDDVPVFCISLKAGGTGLNLTAADIVIHYDPWWNVAAQNQATDRAHRIGQTNVVTVYQLIAADTIEEKIINLQKSKSRLAEDVLSGGEISSILIDREQIMSLLG